MFCPCISKPPVRVADEPPAATAPAPTATPSGQPAQTAPRPEASALRVDFDKFADAKDDKGETRMSRAGLVCALAALNLTRDVDEVMAHFDIDRKGWIDFAAFQLIVMSDPEVEMLVRSLGLERIVAAHLPKGTSDSPLAGLLGMTDAAVDTAVAACVPLIAACLKANIQKAKAAKNAMDKSTSADGAKFANPLKGGEIDYYFKGVTALVGEPTANLELGVKREHTTLATCDKKFSTANYGVTTTPQVEYTLVVEGGAGMRRVGGGAVEVKGTRRSPQGGNPQKDERVLRPLEDYGVFREDGSLEDVVPRDHDSQVQLLVKRAGLTRVEVVVVILYTGPMFLIYNGILRGFGACGAVPEDVEFGSDDFWKAFNAETVARRMEEAGHMFASTLHVLASAVKKLQKVSTDGQGTRVYRGLGGLDVRDFLVSLGFAEKAFMSTTKNLGVALEYSGAKHGKVGTVLAMELSEANKGAALVLFSQYPGEQETLFNACAYLEALRGKGEILMTEWGPVRIILVRVNANGRAQTVEELLARRKNVALDVLHTLEGVVREYADHAAASDVFEERVKKDKHPEDRDRLVASIKKEVATRVQVYEEKPPAYFTESANLGKAVNDALDLPLLARGKLMLWFEDFSIDLREVGDEENPLYIDFQKARGRGAALRQHKMLTADEEDLKWLAVRECVERRLIPKETDLETRDELSRETPLFTRASIGDTDATKLLCQAGADLDFQLEGDQSTALHRCAEMGFLDVCEQLIAHKATLDTQNKDGFAPLHLAVSWGRAEIIARLIDAGASVDLQEDGDGQTPLSLAAMLGRVEAAVRLIDAGASVNLQDNYGNAPLHLAALQGAIEITARLIDAGASVDLQNEDGMTPLKMAEGSGEEEVAALLRKHSATA